MGHGRTVKWLINVAKLAVEIRFHLLFRAKESCLGESLLSAMLSNPDAKRYYRFFVSNLNEGSEAQEFLLSTFFFVHSWLLGKHWNIFNEWNLSSHKCVTMAAGLSPAFGEALAARAPGHLSKQHPKAGHYFEAQLGVLDITELAMHKKPIRCKAVEVPHPDGLRNGDSHYVYILKKLDEGRQSVVYLADISSQEIKRAPGPKSKKQLHAIKLMPRVVQACSLRIIRNSI